jgi:hypothetical protein
MRNGAVLSAPTAYAVQIEISDESFSESALLFSRALVSLNVG